MLHTLIDGYLVQSRTMHMAQLYLNFEIFYLLDFYKPVGFNIFFISCVTPQEITL